jgi:hypothetical protein
MTEEKFKDMPIWLYWKGKKTEVDPFAKGKHLAGLTQRMAGLILSKIAEHEFVNFQYRATRK